jgi:hypothetical protein
MINISSNLFFIAVRIHPEPPHKLIEFINTCSSIYPSDGMCLSIGYGVLNNWNVSYGVKNIT